MPLAQRVKVIASSAAKKTRIAFARSRFQQRHWLSYKLARDPSLVMLKNAIKACWSQQQKPYCLPPDFILERGSSQRVVSVIRLARRVWIFLLQYLFAVYAFFGVLGFASLMILQLIGIHLGDISASVSIVTSVIAIGVPLITTLAGIRDGGGYTQEYLFRITRMKYFAFFAAISASVAILASVITSAVVSGLAVGFSVATVLALTAIILEIIHFTASPSFAWAATANYASMSLLELFLSKAYLEVFINRHQRALNDLCNNSEQLDGPGDYHKYYLATYPDEHKRGKNDVVVHLNYRIQSQYIDYDLRYLQKLEMKLGEQDAKFCFTHHSYTEKRKGSLAYLGYLISGNPDFIVFDPACISSRNDFCVDPDRFRLDSMEDAFLSTVKLTLDQHDRAGFRLHIRALNDALVEFGKIWGEAIIRKNIEERRREEEREKQEAKDKDTKLADETSGLYKLPHDLYPWLGTYRHFLSQVLHHKPLIDRTPHRSTVNFVKCLQDEFSSLMETCIAAKDLGTFEVLTYLVPDLYSVLDDFCRKPDGVQKESMKPIWAMRAKWGRLYASVSDYFSDAFSGEEQGSLKWRFLLYTHRSMCVWIRACQDIERSDTNLINELARYLGKVIELSVEWGLGNPTEPESIRLKVRHWCFLGQMLKKGLDCDKGDESVDARLIESIVPDSESTPDELLQFLDKHRDDVGGHSDWYSDFEPEYEFKEMPIRGGGVGDVRNVANHADEMCMAFLYLLVKSKRRQKPEAISMQLQADWVIDNLNRIKGACRMLGHLRFPPWTEEWLRDCQGTTETEDRKRVADASFDAARIQEYKETFWTKFRENLHLIQYLKRIEAYRDVEEAKRGPYKQLIIKREVIERFGNRSYGLSGSSYGENYARGLDQGLMIQMLEKYPEEQKQAEDLAEAIKGAAQWLKEHCPSEHKGIIFLHANHYLDELFEGNKNFVPAWRDPQSVQGSIGRYDGRILWAFYGKKYEDRVMAVCFARSKPLIIQSGVLEEQWGLLEIRNLTDDEIRDLLAKKESTNEMDLHQSAVLELRFDFDFDLSCLDGYVTTFIAGDGESQPQG